MTTHRKLLGKLGEDAVAAYLERQGYGICARNFSCSYGEIDIIATKGDVIAFIEVKTRVAEYFNFSQVIVPAKQRKIIATARYYLAHCSHKDKIYRFDIALVKSGDTLDDITYVAHAFTDEENVV